MAKNWDNTTMQLFLSGLQTVQLAERNFRLIVISEKSVFFSLFFPANKKESFFVSYDVSK